MYLLVFLAKSPIGMGNSFLGKVTTLESLDWGCVSDFFFFFFLSFFFYYYYFIRYLLPVLPITYKTFRNPSVASCVWRLRSNIRDFIGDLDLPAHAHTKFLRFRLSTSTGQRVWWAPMRFDPGQTQKLSKSKILPAKTLMLNYFHYYCFTQCISTFGSG